MEAVIINIEYREEAVASFKADGCDVTIRDVKRQKRVSRNIGVDKEDGAGMRCSNCEVVGGVM